MEGALGKLSWGRGGLTTPVSPAGWNPLPFCIGGRKVGGGRIGAERQVGEKTQEKSLVRSGIESSWKLLRFGIGADVRDCLKQII